MSGFILQAMGSDFYPRLTAVSEAIDAECNRLVNEQAPDQPAACRPGCHCHTDIRAPGHLVFYAGTFAGGGQPLRWICLGMALASSPGRWVTLSWQKARAPCSSGLRSLPRLSMLGWPMCWSVPFGLTGATMAFCGLYVWHGMLIYAIVRRLTGFRWSEANRRIGLLFLPLIAVVFCGFFVLPGWAATAFGSLCALVSGFYSLRVVCRLVSFDRIPGFLKPLLG